MTAPLPTPPEWIPLAASLDAPQQESPPQDPPQQQRPTTTRPAPKRPALPPLIAKGASSSPAPARRPSQSAGIAEFVRDHVLRRFELYAATMTISFLGFAAGLVWADAGASLTFVTAVVGMGAIQLSIQWAVRERERRLRSQAVVEIREMLRDRVLNQLAVMRVRAAVEGQGPGLNDVLNDINDAVDQVHRMIDDLSEAELDTWRLTYANAVDHISLSPPEA
jgi:hypothetical protein